VIVIKFACGLNSLDGVLALHAVLQVLISSDSERRSFSKVLKRFVVAMAKTTTRRNLALFILVLLTVKCLVGIPSHAQ